MKKLERKSNFELLRIITMVMIVTMHILDHSGIFISKNFNNFNFIIASIVNTLSIVAVNCYILISGYFGCKQNFKKEKIIKLYLHVVFISISISVIFWILNLQSINMVSIIKTFMPILGQNWWFISVYFVLYLLTPYINKMIENISKIELERLIFIGILVFVIWPSISIGEIINPINVDSGYGLYNFVLLYIIGSYIRLYRDEIKINKYIYIIVYLVSMFTLATINLILTNITKVYIAKLSYDFILTYIGAISLFLFFKEINVKSHKINLFSSLTLGIYLIHEHMFIREMMQNFIKEQKFYEGKLFIIYIILIIVFIYCISSVLEYIRIKIFDYIYIKKKERYDDRYKLKV